jgi:hypothetical protein
MDDIELAELVGRLGNIYTKKGLSPPFALGDVAKYWSGLTQDEIVTVVQKHFAEDGVHYGGSGDEYFGMVQSAIRKALETKHPPRDHADDEPLRPRRRSGGVHKVHNASGFPDVIVDREDGESIDEDAEDA